MKQIKAIPYLICLSVSTLVAAPAVVVNDSELKAEPNFQAAVEQVVKQGESVDIVRRNRGWYFVELPASIQGWMNMLTLRYQTAPEPGLSSMIFSSLKGIKQGSDNITATTGIRGIVEADLLQSKPDFEALKASLDYVVDGRIATNYAKVIPLQSTDIDYPEAKND